MNVPQRFHAKTAVRASTATGRIPAIVRELAMKERIV